jgi:hypothetical protein
MLSAYHHSVEDKKQSYLISDMGTNSTRKVSMKRAKLERHLKEQTQGIYALKA